MVDHGKPAVRRACRGLEQLIDDLRADGRNLLPSVKTLAHTLHVSQGTVCRAIDLLKTRGVLCSRKGKGTWLRDDRQPSPTHAPPPPGSEPRSRWEQVRDQIAQDHLSGIATGPGSLPGQAFLAQEYGASHRTVRRALAALADDGRLVAHGRGYRPGRTPASPSRAGIVLIRPAASSGQPAARFPNEDENIARLELECSARGVRVHHYLLSSGLDRVFPRTTHTSDTLTRIHDQVLGVVAWLPGSAGNGIDTVLRATHPLQAPVAIAGHRTRLRHALPRHPSVTLCGFCTAGYGRADGTEVATYLLQKGYQTIAAIFPGAGTSDQRDERLDGLRRTLQPHAQLRELLLSPEANRRHGDFAGLVEQVSSEVSSRPGAPQLHCHLARAITEDRIPLQNLVRRYQHEQAVRAAWQTAAPSPLPDAVVCWNDTIAHACLELFVERGIRVPQDISLVSFDDSPIARTGDITSYNFNEGQILLSMLNWVLWPSTRKSGSIVPLPRGFVVERGSVG